MTRKPAALAGGHHCLELNKALTRLVSADQMARFVAENVRAFNAINVATACHRLAKTHQLCGKMHSRGHASGPSEDARQSISALIARASETVGNFKQQQVAILMWALPRWRRHSMILRSAGPWFSRSPVSGSRRKKRYWVCALHVALNDSRFQHSDRPCIGINFGADALGQAELIGDMAKLRALIHGHAQRLQMVHQHL